MSIIGDASLWADLFPDHLVPDILGLVITTWQRFKKPTLRDLEVPITRRFREELRREKDFRELPFTIWPESSETDSTTGKEIGRIDIRFLHGYREDVYFAFECKRLRIPYESGIRSNASEYVGIDGMMCFITGKYSKALASGGMIGYVMDSDVTSAIHSVKEAIDRSFTILCLVRSTSLSSCSIMPNEKIIKETRHELPNRKFTIYHIFLAVNMNVNRVRHE